MFRFMDSFDNYNAPAVGALGKWQSYVVVSSDVLTIQPGLGRNGGAALQYSAGTNPTYLQGVISSPLSRVVVGVALSVLAFPLQEVPILSFVDTITTQVTVALLPNGQIRFHEGTLGGATLATSSASVITATNNFFYLEFDITFNSITGAIVLHANGANVTLSASTGLNTAPSGNNNFNVHRIGLTDSGANPSGGSKWLYDDFYIVDTTGPANNTFLGDTRIACMFPNGNGPVTQMTPNGAATNWQCVNEASEDGDTTYVSSATAGQKDLYTKNASPADTGPIFAAQLCSVARKDDAGTRSIANTVRSNATDLDGATKPLNTTYSWFLDIYETDPNTGSPWTKTGFDAAWIGVKVAV